MAAACSLEFRSGGSHCFWPLSPSGSPIRRLPFLSSPPTPVGLPAVAVSALCAVPLACQPAVLRAPPPPPRGGSGSAGGGGGLTPPRPDAPPSPLPQHHRRLRHQDVQPSALPGGQPRRQLVHGLRYGLGHEAAREGEWWGLGGQPQGSGSGSGDTLGCSVRAGEGDSLVEWPPAWRDTRKIALSDSVLLHLE